MIPKRIAKFLSLSAIVMLAAGCGSASTSPAASTADNNQSVCKTISGTATVVMKDGSFDPDTITVKQCTQVTFQNAGTRAHWPASDFHPTHGIYPEFDPQRNVDPGQSWSFVFDRIGQWHYHDHLFPGTTGVVKVTAN